MNKEIVFLDFDGVIFPFGSYNIDVSDALRNPDNYVNTFYEAADWQAINDLKAFLHDKHVVVISTWRYLFSTTFIRMLMSEIGIKIDDIAIENESVRQSKERDITNYLWSHEHTGDWYLIDDEDGHMPSHIASGTHIKTDPRVGFRLKDV